MTEICCIWKTLMKMCLVMVIIIKLTQQDIANYISQNGLAHPNRLTVVSQKTEFWKIGQCTFQHTYDYRSLLKLQDLVNMSNEVVQVSAIIFKF